MLDSSDDLWRSYAFSRRVLGDRYRLDDLVAARGASAYFRAHDVATGRSVAVEVVNPGRAPGPEADRFRQRARTAAAVPAAPHLLRASDWGADDELTYLVVEPVAGIPLDAWIRTHDGVTLGARVHVLAQAARGLETAHAAGLIHGAFTAGCVIVDPSADAPAATVAGFGLGEMVAALTGMDAAPWAGSSPEQLRRDPRLTPATDVYGLGLLAYHLLAGAEPFTDRDRVDLRNRRPVHPAAPDVVNPELPPALSRIIIRALSPEPLRRYADAGAFADALGRVTTETPGSGWRETAGPPWPVAEPAPSIPGAALDADATATLAQPIGAPRSIPLGAADAAVLADAKIAFERARTPIAPHPLKPELIDARRVEPTLERRGAWVAADEDAGDDELAFTSVPRGRSWAGVLMVGGMALFGGALLGAAGWSVMNQVDGAQATRAITATPSTPGEEQAQPEPAAIVEALPPSQVLVTAVATTTDTVQSPPTTAAAATVEAESAAVSTEPEPATAPAPAVREPSVSAPAVEATPRDEPEPKSAPRPAESRAEPEPEPKPAEPRAAEPRTDAREPRDTLQLDAAPAPRPRRDAPRDTIRIPR